MGFVSGVLGDSCATFDSWLVGSNGFPIPPRNVLGDLKGFDCWLQMASFGSNLFFCSKTPRLAPKG